MSEVDTVVIDEDDLDSLMEGETLTRKGHTFVYDGADHGTDLDEYDCKLTENTVERFRNGCDTARWNSVEVKFNNDSNVDNTVTLEAEVDVSAATDEQREMYHEMAEIFADRFKLFIEKNLDYDSSFVSAGKVEQALDSGEGPFENEKESNLYKLFTRIQDKDQRFYSLAFTDNEDRVGETAAETAGDAGVYWFMAQWLIEYYNE